MEKSYKGSALSIVIIVVIVILIIGGGVSYYLAKNFATKNNQATAVCPKDSKTCPDGSSVGRIAPKCEFATCPEVKVSNESVAKDKYKLFDASLLEKTYANINGYYDDGLINTGLYAGYNRVVVSTSQIMETEDYILATKDYKTYILDKTNEKSFNSEYNILNKSKISIIDNIPSNFPDKIDLGNFILISSGVDNYAGNSTKEEIYLESSDLKFYTLSYKPTIAPTEISYYNGHATLNAEDASGLNYIYNLVSKESLADDGWYNVSKFYEKSDFTENINALYPTYGAAHGCGLSSIGLLQNITENDLVRVTQTKNGVVLFAPKDKNHSINKGSFESKYFSDDDKPTYEQYVAKNPVLIFKDPFDRYVAVFEAYYQEAGGCGKPVIYLYPEKDTKVTLKFVEPINITTSIPTYKNQWNVLAKPNGQLVDLQPSLTDCSKIDNTKPGSEYAKNACETNAYPYIYWAGQASGAYPEQNQGWIVESVNVEKFLSEKLFEIGFTQQEKKDMMDYWVPALLSKNVPYYKISFIQTHQMNSFIPMDVTPRPDTVLRIFLDWKPFSQKPAEEIIPQKLFHFNRQGFSLVEWGGLKIH